MSENPDNFKSSNTSPDNAVINWDSIIYKNVRTLDNQGIGKVTAIPQDEDTTIIISSQSSGEQYKIPKASVSGFNGAEVLLNETAYRVLSSYRIDNAYTYVAKPNDIIAKRNQEEKKDTTVSVIEERLNVSKKVSTTQFTITKEPDVQKKTVEVPITHEELVIEKRAPKDSSPIPSPVTSKTEIKVPLYREEVEVTKEPYVKEEVVVKKKPVTETRTVSDTVTKERADTLGIDMASPVSTRTHE
jgi:uncharacterized protein (TIGR02271 family)